MKKSLMVIASLAVAVAMVPVGHASAANITALDEGEKSVAQGKLGAFQSVMEDCGSVGIETNEHNEGLQKIFDKKGNEYHINILDDLTKKGKNRPESTFGLWGSSLPQDVFFRLGMGI